MDLFKYVLGLVGTAMTVVWLVSARVTTVEADIDHLKTKTEKIETDHDRVTVMETDIKYIREAIDDLRHALLKGTRG
jgi:predicted RNA methylase